MSSLPELVEGILVEHVTGMSLVAYIQKAAPCALLSSTVIRLCEDAIKMFEELEAHEIMHGCPYTFNVMVQLDPGELP